MGLVAYFVASPTAEDTPGEFLLNAARHAERPVVSRTRPSRPWRTCSSAKRGVLSHCRLA
ncbi:MAG: hypothetical protein ACXVXI_07055 [Mycobacteriaceae bacterium]